MYLLSLMPCPPTETFSHWGGHARNMYNFSCSSTPPQHIHIHSYQCPLSPVFFYSVDSLTDIFSHALLHSSISHPHPFSWPDHLRIPQPIQYFYNPYCTLVTPLPSSGTHFSWSTFCIPSWYSRCTSYRFHMHHPYS